MSSCKFQSIFSVRRLAAPLFLLATLLLPPFTTSWRAQAEPQQASAAKGFTLRIVVEGVRNSRGNIGYLLFNSAKGWPDEMKDAFRGDTVAAVAGRTVIQLNNLPAGDYGVLIIHDENNNRKLDRDWKGMPSEQWGMSNNPRVYLSAPSFDKARFHLSGDREIHIVLK